MPNLECQGHQCEVCGVSWRWVEGHPVFVCEPGTMRRCPMCYGCQYINAVEYEDDFDHWVREVRSGIYADKV